MGDLIFIATEKCLMSQLMKSACEKTPVVFLQQISSEGGGGGVPPPFLGAQFSVALY